MTKLGGCRSIPLDNSPYDVWGRCPTEQVSVSQKQWRKLRLQNCPLLWCHGRTLPTTVILDLVDLQLVAVLDLDCWSATLTVEHFDPLVY